MDNHANRIAKLSPEKRTLLELTLKQKELALPVQQIIASIANRGPVPLSFAQQRLWFLSKLDPDSSAYNQPKAIRLTGELNFQTLNKALDTIVERHEVLRSTLLSPDGESPVQLVGEPRAVDLSTVDLTECSNADLETELQSRLVKMTERPFELSRDLLLRATLLRLGPADHVLLLVTHHIASDGWSSGILWREFAILYGAFSKREPNPLPELPIQYADYAVWQRNWLQGEGLQTQISYWKKQLAEISVLQLPTDRPRPAVQSYRGAKQSLLISKALADQLHVLSRKEGVTLFMTLLATFQTLLYRYSGQDDIALGSPIAGRTRSETEGLIGFFVNTLVLRTDLSGNPSFRELLDRVRKMALAAYEHQDLPFEKLVEELHPDRDLSRTPLFQVMVAHQNVPSQPLELPDLIITPVEIKNETAKFDLSLDISENTEGLKATLEYGTDLFDDATIGRMLNHFQTLLEGIVADPDQHISNLPILTKAEKHQLLVEWNDTKKDYPKDKCIHELFEEQVAKSADAIALVFEDEQLSYRDLNVRANQLARYLRNLGVGPDVLVGLCLERSLDMLVGVLGILKAGGAYVPLDPAYPNERLAFMLEDTQAAVLLTQRRLVEKLTEREKSKVIQNEAEEVADGDFRSAILDPRIHVVYLDGDWKEIARQSEARPESEVTQDNLAYVIYTSGSTGKPKGALITHSNLVNAYLAWEEAYQLQSAAPVYLQMANFTFDVFSGDWVRALCSGGKLVLCPTDFLLDAPQLYALMRREEVDCGDFVPLVMGNLLNYLEDTGQTLNFMRLLVVGSEVWYVQEYEKIQRLCGPNTRVMNSYGLTEATIDSSFFCGNVRALSPNRSVPIGRPFANTQLYIVDRHLQLAPVGVPGELCISGAGLARGYLNRAELTAEKFIANPFANEPGVPLYKTGDRARWRSDGNVEFLGRLDNQIKIRGFRVEFGEIEATLGNHPALRGAVVLVQEGVENIENSMEVRDGKACNPKSKSRNLESNLRLVAYVVSKQAAIPTASELRGFLSATLPEYMVPSRFVFLDALPLTPNGKVDRQALPALDQNKLNLKDGFVAPRTPDEILMVNIWTDVLNLKQIGIYDNFFDLGGHSLLATQIISRVRKVFAVDLPLRELFEAPTVAGMAAAVLRKQCNWTDQQNLADLLSDLESLPSEEVQRILPKN